MKRLTLFVSMCMLMFTIGCSNDDNGLTNSDKQALALAGVVLSDVNGLFAATSDNDGSMAPSAARSGEMDLRKNFYPGMEDQSGEIKQNNAVVAATFFDGQTPADVAPASGVNIYTFADDQGNYCVLSVGAKNSNNLYPISYKVSPNYTISVDYSFEQILTTAATWDPVNANGVVDFTARSPYYTRYFDGRIDDMVVTDVQNGKTINPAIKLSFAPLTTTDYISTEDPGTPGSPDLNDFYSKVEFTAGDDKNNDGVAEGIQYGSGQRFYSENKTGSAVVEAVTKEYNTMEYGKQWDILDLFKSATRECYVTDNVYTGTDSVATTASVVESTDSLLWNLINIDSQTIGQFVKSKTGSAIDVDAFYASVSTVWKLKQYTYKTLEMTGTAKTMTGTILVYRSFITKPAALVDLPLTDANRASLSISQVNGYKLADPATVFSGSPISYAITHGSDEDGEYTVSAQNVKLTDDSESFTTSVKYNKVNRKVSLNLNSNYLTISEGDYENGAVIGKVTIKGNEYEIKIYTANGKCVIKQNGKWVAL